CEGPAAVPVAVATAAHGAALRATPWPHGGRETMRGQCQDDSALAGAVAARRRARAGTTLSPAPRPPHYAPTHRAHWPSAPRPGVRGAAPQLWLRRVHEVRMAVGTIQRIFRDIGLARLRRTPKRVPRQMKLFEKAEPGESVQVDVKFVKIAGHWAFQYTALDDCTRFRVLRLYRRLHQSSSLAFLGELCRAFPFRIRKLQCDNGHEFPFAFALAVEALGIRHRYIKPRRPQQNGKVERSHRIDHEEFWSRQRFDDFAAATVGLRAWESRYNHERFSLALQGRTPGEKLASLLPAPAA